MRTAGIEGVRRTKRVRTTKPDPDVPRHPDLVGRDFTAAGPEPAVSHHVADSADAVMPIRGTELRGVWRSRSAPPEGRDACMLPGSWVPST